MFDVYEVTTQIAKKLIDAGLEVRVNKSRVSASRYVSVGYGLFLRKNHPTIKEVRTSIGYAFSARVRVSDHAPVRAESTADYYVGNYDGARPVEDHPAIVAEIIKKSGVGQFVRPTPQTGEFRIPPIYSWQHYYVAETTALVYKAWGRQAAYESLRYSPWAVRWPEQKLRREAESILGFDPLHAFVYEAARAAGAWSTVGPESGSAPNRSLEKIIREALQLGVPAGSIEPEFMLFADGHNKMYAPNWWFEENHLKNPRTKTEDAA